MDTGKMHNYKYYDGYEGEPEIILCAKDINMEILHIWDGFWDDIFGNPPDDGRGWIGFTRDYNQCEGAFDTEGEGFVTNLYEYAKDLISYKVKEFDFKETYAVYDLLCSWFEEAIQRGCKSIAVKIN